jgi:sugar lactone lactonase YvrE
MKSFAIATLVLAGCGSPSASEDASTPRDAGRAVDARRIDGGPGAFRAVYPVTAQFPEGGAFDPESQTFFVGSLADGSVHAIDALTGAERVLFTESLPGAWWTLGMDVDVARRQLWVCAMEDRRELEDDPDYEGYVWVFDLESGERIARHVLGDAFETATCTDVAVAADGTAYVCDREHPNLYRIDETGVTIFATDDALDGAVVGQNGLVVLPDQSALLSIVYLPSSLVHVRLSDAQVTDVDIDGDFLDGTPALSGADGMAFVDGSALVQFTSQLVRVTPTLADWSTASAVSVDVPEGMTEVIATPQGQYLLNGQAVQYLLGSDTDPFQLVRFDGSF